MYWKTYICIFLKKSYYIPKVISHSFMNYYHVSIPPLLLAETLHVYQVLMTRILFLG